MKLVEHYLNAKRLTLVLVMSMDYLVVLQICLNDFLSSVGLFHFLPQGAKGKSGGKGSKGDGGEKVRTST